MLPAPCHTENVCTSGASAKIATWIHRDSRVDDCDGYMDIDVEANPKSCLSLISQFLVARRAEGKEERATTLQSPCSSHVSRLQRCDVRFSTRSHAKSLQYSLPIFIRGLRSAIRGAGTLPSHSYTSHAVALPLRVSDRLWEQLVSPGSTLRLTKDRPDGLTDGSVCIASG